ncbi:MAG: hypothetical protein ACYC1C_04390 [Chloroflexota bacterium]
MQVASSVQVVGRRTWSWRQPLGIVLRGLLAMVLLFVCLTVSSTVVDTGAKVADADPAASLLGVLGMCFLYTIALSYPVIRSRWTGWKLVGAVFVAYAGITPILLQVETVVFLLFLVPIIPAEVLPRIIANGFLTAALFSPLLVLVFGKLRTKTAGAAAAAKSRMSAMEWAWKLILIGVVYNVIYFTFGNLVAVPLAGDAFGEYYRDLVVPAWLPLVQVGRGMLWALVMLPVIRMMKGSWWEAGLAVALLSALLSAAPLFVPNQFMPDQMRFAHFFELLSSNFLFGWTIVWVFHRHHSSWRDLLGLAGSK